MTTTKEIALSGELVEEANSYLQRLPKTPDEVIEHWAQLGQKLAGEMTEIQAMQFLLGNLEVKFVEIIEDR